MTEKSALKIRYRTRRGYAKEAQGYTSWGEYQVVDGRKVVGRFDFEDQAQKFIAASPHQGEPE